MARGFCRAREDAGFNGLEDSLFSKEQRKYCCTLLLPLDADEKASPIKTLCHDVRPTFTVNVVVNFLFFQVYIYIRCNI